MWQDTRSSLSIGEYWHSKVTSELGRVWLFARTHWELYPNNRDLTPGLVDELRDIALHAAAGPSNTFSTSVVSIFSYQALRHPALQLLYGIRNKTRPS